jgi:hypothetical protein
VTTRYHRWFVVTPGSSWSVEGGELVQQPQGLRHAKTFGSTVTACGIPTLSWRKFWGLPFEMSDGGSGAGSGAAGRPAACPECVQALVSIAGDDGSRVRIRGMRSA